MRTGAMLLVAVTVVGVLYAETSAAPFDPLFVVSKITGTCQVMEPGMNQMVLAEEGKAYPLGTELVTGARSGCTVIFSTANECAIGEETRLVVAEGSDPRQRIINLEDGKVEITLEENFQAANALEVVTHCCAASALKGGGFSVQVKNEEDLQAVLVAARGGEVKVVGPRFEIANLREDQAVSVSCSQDRSFTRVKCVNGNISAAVLREAEAEPAIIAMVPGYVIKILQKLSEPEGALVVTILAVAPDGTVDQAVSYTTKATETLAAPVTASEATGTPKVEKPRKVIGEAEEWEPIWSSTTTTSTTTTTIPTPEEEYEYIRHRPVPATTTTTVPRKKRPPTPTPVGRF